MAEFDVQAHTTDGSHVLRLSGDIDRAAQAPLDAAYDGAGRDGRLVLDFTDVEYINSTGIAVIVGVLAKARAAGRAVAARGLSDHYREVFRITRLSDFMDIGD